MGTDIAWGLCCCSRLTVALQCLQLLQVKKKKSGEAPPTKPSALSSLAELTPKRRGIDLPPFRLLFGVRPAKVERVKRFTGGTGLSGSSILVPRFPPCDVTTVSCCRWLRSWRWHSSKGEYGGRSCGCGNAVTTETLAPAHLRLQAPMKPTPGLQQTTACTSVACFSAALRPLRTHGRCR
uniref:Putative secreted protein n=1 Tax=Ixodes ricinus TaxID=34613 RepID=A0A6B0V020_IXORI